MYKKLFVCHLILWFFLVIDIVMILNYNTSYRGVWIDRLLVYSIFLNSVSIYVFFRKRINKVLRLYFGFYLFYPILILFSFFIDKIFFAIVSAPLIIVINVPHIYYQNNEYEIRNSVSVIGMANIELIRKNVFTETYLGSINLEDIKSQSFNHIESFKVISTNHEFTMVLLNSNSFVFKNDR